MPDERNELLISTHRNFMCCVQGLAGRWVVRADGAETNSTLALSPSHYFDIVSFAWPVHVFTQRIAVAICHCVAHANVARYSRMRSVTRKSSRALNFV